MSFTNILFGRPLRSSEEGSEKLGPTAGIAIFGLDALSSAAYGPEAALTLLIPLGAAGIAYLLPITGSIIILLAIVYFSYRQTIEAYPTGGGSYTVARQNLGEFPGLRSVFYEQGAGHCSVLIGSFPVRKAAVNAPQSKRFAKFGRSAAVAKRLDCGGFSTAVRRQADFNSCGHA